MARRLMGLMAGAVLTLSATPAQAYVYWGHGSTANSGAIGRAALDGTGKTDAFIPSPATTTKFAPAIAADGTSLFWLSYTANVGIAQQSIARALADGSDLARPFGLTANTAVQGIDVDATSVYTAGNASGKGYVTKEAKAGGGYAEFTSSGVGTNPKTCDVAVDDTYIYFSNPGTFSIGRAKLDPFGADLDGQFIKLPVGWQPCAIAVDATHVYWAVTDIAPASLGKAIGRAKKDGSEQIDERWAADGRITGLAVDKDYVYWASSGSGTAPDGAIGRAKKDSTGSDTNWITGLTFPAGVAVDALGPVASAPTPDIVSPATAPPATVSSGGSGTGSGSSISACGATPCPPGGRPDFSRVWATRTTFAPSSRSTATSGPARVKTATARGTTFNFIVDRAATVVISIQRSCRKGAGTKRCARPWAKVARLTRTAAGPGTYSLPFTGRIRGRALAPGRYRAVFTATAAGATGTATAVAFRVVRG